MSTPPHLCNMTSSKFTLFFLLLISSVEKSFSIVPDTERFSSSIVASDNELLFGLQRPKHTHHERSSSRDAITRSYIDRDPIYFDDYDLFVDNIADEYNNMDSLQHDPLSHFYRRHHHHDDVEQWQSPLERISPLPSSIKKPQVEESPTIHAGSPLTISPGWKHSHQIDVHKQQQHNNNNQQQQQPQYKLKTRSTGTTIAALLAKKSTVLILAADTRATDDSTVADKRCEKLHTLAKNVWCAGAGTSADVEAMVRRVKFTFWKRGVLNGQNVGIGNMGSSATRGVSSTQLLSSSEDNDVPIASVMAILHYLRTQLQKTRGSLGVNLLVGGYEYGLQRAYLAAVHPHGSMDVVTYAALGSGGLAATGVLESRYPQVGCSECTVEEGIRLAVDAVKAGIDNDLGSGSQVDVCVISADGVMYRRAIVKEEELEWINDNDSWYDDARKEKDNDQLVASGVNGFGNLPFSFQSKKIVVGGRIEAEREQREWLNGVLRAEKE
jgi:20S proteasome subunit beta 2